MIVLDASALLALLFREPGHERVFAALGDCCMSTINLAGSSPSPALTGQALG